jgi:uncharacterized phage protein gp47/JayE
MTVALAEEWPLESVQPDEEEAIYDLLIALQAELNRIEEDIEDLYKQRFVDTATGEELERLGSEVGIVKQTGESEERYRLRVKIAKSISRSDGSLPALARTLDCIFDDGATSISISTVNAEPATQITVPSKLLNNISLTRSELEDELRNFVPVNDRIEIVTDDTWLLGESGSQGLGDGGLI